MWADFGTKELETVAPVTAVRGTWTVTGRAGNRRGRRFCRWKVATYICCTTVRRCTLIRQQEVCRRALRHTHALNFYKKKGVLYFNPGSRGRRRFELPVTVGLLTIGADGELAAEIISLDQRRLR